MNTKKAIILCLFVLSAGFSWLLPWSRSAEQNAPADWPPVLTGGLKAYASGGPEAAVRFWQRSGPLDGDKEALAPVEDFKEWERSFGNYRSYELVEAKSAGQASRLIYVALHFERGAVFGCFQVYQTSKNWVVQRMEFNPEPEALMPWLVIGRPE